MALLGGVDADAGIGRPEAQGQGLRDFGQHFGTELDVPLPGKLDGIDEQVEQDLVQPIDIAHHAPRVAGRRPHFQPQVLGRRQRRHRLPGPASSSTSSNNISLIFR